MSHIGFAAILGATTVRNWHIYCHAYRPSRSLGSHCPPLVHGQLVKQEFQKIKLEKPDDTYLYMLVVQMISDRLSKYRSWRDPKNKPPIFIRVERVNAGKARFTFGFRHKEVDRFISADFQTASPAYEELMEVIRFLADCRHTYRIMGSFVDLNYHESPEAYGVCSEFGPDPRFQSGDAATA